VLCPLARRATEVALPSVLGHGLLVRFVGGHTFFFKACRCLPHLVFFLELFAFLPTSRTLTSLSTCNRLNKTRAGPSSTFCPFIDVASIPFSHLPQLKVSRVSIEEMFPFFLRFLGSVLGPRLLSCRLLFAFLHTPISFSLLLLLELSY